MIDEFQRTAVGFSITFDAWTSRFGRAGFVAITYHWLSTNPIIRYRRACFQVMHVTKAHTAAHLAFAIAKALDDVTTEKQVMYGVATDNAANVVKCAKALINHLEDLQRGNEGDAAEILEENDAEDDDDVELMRAHGCVDHSLNLAVRDTLDGDLKSKLERARGLVVAVKRSQKLQLRLSAILRTLGMPQLRVKLDCVTRWNSTFDMLKRFLAVWPALQIMAIEGDFDECDGVYALPDKEDILLVEYIVRSLEVIKSASKLFEGDQYATLAHVPFFVKLVLRRLRDDRNIYGALIRKIRHELADNIEHRLHDCIFDARSPAYMAAAVHPLYGGHLQALMDMKVGSKCHSDINLSVRDTYDQLAEWHVFFSESSDASGSEPGNGDEEQKEVATRMDEIFGTSQEDGMHALHTNPDKTRFNNHILRWMVTLMSTKQTVAPGTFALSSCLNLFSNFIPTFFKPNHQIMLAKDDSKEFFEAISNMTKGNDTESAPPSKKRYVELRSFFLFQIYFHLQI